MAKAVCEDTGQLEAAGRLIARSRKVAVLAHINPDGDTLGSSLALARALTQMGKRAVVVCADTLPENLSYLPGYDSIQTDPALPADLDTLVLVDASEISRLGRAYEVNADLFARAATLNIDHHMTSSCFGQVNMVNAEAAATGEQVYDLLLSLGHPIDTVVATCLLTALVTDTRVFRTASTTPRTLALAAHLFELGAPLHPIVETVYRNRPLPTLKLWGLALQSLQWREGVAWAVITRAMQEAAGAGPSDGDGVVDLISSLRGARAVALFRETDDGIKVSLRATNGVDVSEVATHFSGGGHPRASGCLLSGDLTAAVDEVIQYLVARAGAG